MASSGIMVVEHMTRHTKAEGLSPATTAGTREWKWQTILQQLLTFCQFLSSCASSSGWTQVLGLRMARQVFYHCATPLCQAVTYKTIFTKFAYLPTSFNAAIKNMSYIKNCFWVNYGRPAASFCYQVAACVSDMFGKFYLVKNHNIANNSTTTNARESMHGF